MRTFIHVKIIMPNEFDFQNEAMNWVKINFPEASLFDFDNNSSAEIFQYSTQFLNAATEKIILIEKKSEGDEKWMNSGRHALAEVEVGGLGGNEYILFTYTHIIFTYTHTCFARQR